MMGSVSMIKVSVIMPCLNMEKYIESSIKSVIEQTLKEIEILIIDAGSTDGTLDIIEKYKSIDTRIKLIHSPVKSYGYQMNMAVKIAQGEYIGIVETDDYIELDTYETLYKEISQTDAEYIKGKTIAFINEDDFTYEREWMACSEWKNNDKVILIPKENPRLFISDNFVWNGMYKREYFQQFPFRETRGAAFQDIGVLFKVISNANKAIYLNKIIYHYRQGDLLASSYNHNSLNYVQDEYAALESLVKTLPANWKHIYYKKMLYHTTNRFHFMACENVFWNESEKSITWLQEKIRYAINSGILNREHFKEKDWKDLQLFLEDASLLFQYSQKNFRKSKEIVSQFMNHAKDYEWIIFGYGNVGKKIYNLLCLYKIKLNAYCDNSLNKQGKFIDDIPILSPSDAVKNYPNSRFIIANQNHYEEMKNQLLDMGVENKAIYKKDISQEIFTSFFTFMYLYRDMKNRNILD